MAVLVLSITSCEDPDRLPLVVLDTVEKGAYPRLIDETDKLLNLFDVPGSNYTYNIEFVDEQGGALIAEYVLNMSFDDNDASNGDNSTGPVEFLKITPDQFTENERGYLQAPTITISGSEVLSKAGVTLDQVSAGDNFNFEGRVILTDGRIFSQVNSSATVVGSAFRGHFNFTMPAACPSSLEGTYSFEGSNFWCGAADASGTIEIIARGGGKYSFDDWSLGAYPACYGGLAAGWGTLEFTDVCNTVSFSGFTDNYGDTWEFTSTVDKADWTIEWVNTYGEAGKAVIKANGGEWPFTLK